MITTTPTAIPVGEHLFDEALHHTNITEYGISIEDLTRGRVSPPPEGARFDIAYEGSIEGDRLRGYIRGVDHVEVRADGRFQLNIYATITTDDGEKIALYSGGLLKAPDDTGMAPVYLNMQLTTSAPRYTWANHLQVWGRGHVNMETGEIRVQAYAA